MVVLHIPTYQIVQVVCTCGGESFACIAFLLNGLHLSLKHLSIKFQSKFSTFSRRKTALISLGNLYQLSNTFLTNENQWMMSASNGVNTGVTRFSTLTNTMPGIYHLVKNSLDLSTYFHNIHHIYFAWTFDLSTFIDAYITYLTTHNYHYC